jgi:diguanylate cyclase (GGDEF)-like protein
VHESEKTPLIVVDDDEATRKLLQRQLELAGYQVRAFNDGRAALEAIQTLGAGMVICDWSMPEMDGIELVQALREMEELHVLGHVHFILLTAHNGKERIVEGLKAGASDYLTKPYHVGELMARIAVGQRMLALREELLHHSLELQKTNAQMAVLAGELDRLANTDGLTNLPNRRCLFEQLEKSWATADQTGQPLSCVMLDIDRFKSINDTYGHATGDTVLKAVADAIRDHAQRTEWCGRLGGEEFVLFFPGSALAAAAQAAEQLRNDVAAKPVRSGEHRIGVTISCGVAEKTVVAACADDMIRNADAVMYTAKENGRNQTWAYADDDQAHPVRNGVIVAAEGLPAATPTTSVSRARNRPPEDRVESTHAHIDHQ